MARTMVATTTTTMKCARSLEGEGIRFCQWAGEARFDGGDDDPERGKGVGNGNDAEEDF